MTDAAAASDARLFPGALAPFAAKLLWIKADPGSASRDAGGLDILQPLSRFHRGVGGPWRPACSLWAQTYFNTPLIPAVCLLRADDLDNVVAITASFCPTTGAPLHFCMRTGPGGSKACGSLAASLRTHLGDLIAGLNGLAGLSMRMLWESAARSADWALGQLALEDPARTDGLLSLVRTAGLACDARDGNAVPGRRYCCLRYQLPGFGLCAEICPRDRQARPGPCRHPACSLPDASRGTAEDRDTVAPPDPPVASPNRVAAIDDQHASRDRA